MTKDTMRTVKGYQMRSHNSLTHGLEDYLEMIYRLGSADFTRLSDIARRLGVGASSASKMVQKLGALGFVQYERYGVIRLTKSGRESGAYLMRRHEVCHRFFALLGAGSDALQEAELVEHCLSRSTVERLEALVKQLESNPRLLDAGCEPSAP